MGEILFLGGLAMAGGSVAVAIVVFAVLWVSKCRLNASLDAEYGKKK